MPPPPQDIVNDQIAAYEAGDAERFAACFSADAVCRNLPSGQIIASGRAEIARVWGAVFARGARRATIEARIIQGPFVVDQERVRQAGRDEVIAAVAIYEVRDGEIGNVWFLVDESL